jgi:Nuclease-related domain
VSANVAGGAARAKRDEVNAQAALRNLVARVLGVKTDERAWRVGAKGEEKVGKELTKLPAGWHVLHAVQVSDAGTDIDHVIVGPAGVLTLNTKRHPDGKVTVYERALYVNGARVDYLPKSRGEARRAARLLSDACGFPVPVRSAIVFVDLADIKEKGRPADVLVTTRRRLIDLLRSLPVSLSADQVSTIHERACSRQTWLPTT